MAETFKQYLWKQFYSLLIIFVAVFLFTLNKFGGLYGLSSIDFILAFATAIIFVISYIGGAYLFYHNKNKK